MDQSKPVLVVLLEKCLEFCQRYKKDRDFFLDNCAEEPEFKELTEAMRCLQIKDIFGKKKLDEVYIPEKIHGFTVIDNEEIAVSVFCMSEGSYLSLHDHPKMSVMSIVMDGEIRRVSLNITSSGDLNLGNSLDPNKEIFTAMVSQDDVLKKNDVYYLTPNSNNIHGLYAIKNSILFDVLIPNYNNIDRNCNFYSDVSSINVIEKIKSSIDNLVGKKLALKYLDFPPEMKDFIVSEFTFQESSPRGMQDFFG